MMWIWRQSYATRAGSKAQYFESISVEQTSRKKLSLVKVSRFKVRFVFIRFFVACINGSLSLFANPLSF